MVIVAIRIIIIHPVFVLIILLISVTCLTNRFLMAVLSERVYCLNFMDSLLVDVGY